MKSMGKRWLWLLLLWAGGCTAIPEPPALHPPVSPVVYEPVAAWWYYFPDMSDTPWDYFTQVRKERDPVLVQFRPSNHPEYYRVAQTNESAVHAYNQRWAARHGGARRPAAAPGEVGIRQPQVRASSIPLPGGAQRQQAAMRSARTLPGMGGPEPETSALLPQGVGGIANPRFSIRMGVFGSSSEAEEVKQRLWALGFSSYQRPAAEGAGALIVVNAGPYAERKEAEEALVRLKAQIRRVEGADTFPAEVVPFTP